jgi:DNA polymerase III epsilon subunit-like protein
MMAGVLTDQQFQATTFHVIDFEGTTPRGYRPEPIEVAIISLRVQSGLFIETARFAELMKPPPHAPITPFDTGQTGITPQMVANRPSAAEVMAKFDALLTPAAPALLVAHHASVEAGFLHDYRDHCPNLAATHLLDTVRLAKAVYPGLPSYGLDALMTALTIPRPAGRHRAMPDAEVTVELLRRLLGDGARAGLWATLHQVRKVAGLEPKGAWPHQETLF